MSDQIYGLKQKPHYVLEQQAGPILGGNSVSPEEGIIRVWLYSHFAHNAEGVSFFRWRANAKAAEQYHSGILRYDSTLDVAYNEIQTVTTEFKTIINKYLNKTIPRKAEVCIIISNSETQWMYNILPQSSGFHYYGHAETIYNVFRKHGVNVDVLSPFDKLSGYKLVIIPALELFYDELYHELKSFSGSVIITVRSGSKTKDFSVPLTQPPGIIQEFIPIKVDRSESFDKNYFGDDGIVKWNGKEYKTDVWKEWLRLDNHNVQILATFKDQHSRPAIVQMNNFVYMAFYPPSDFLEDFLMEKMKELEIEILLEEPVANGMNIKRRGNMYFALNFDKDEKKIDVGKGNIILGENPVKPYDVTVWVK